MDLFSIVDDFWLEDRDIQRMDTDSVAETSTGSGSELEYPVGVRLIILNLPEDEGEGLGFRLTRTLWDPYPWVHEVVAGARADVAGLRTGDCLLQADGKDLLGMPVGTVAGLIRGDGAGRGVSLLVWNCGVDPNDDPELLWSCGGGSRGEKSRRALAGVVRALSCCVCAATATKALNCARSHLYCEACWTRLDRCALCRETLPPKDSPYARNLVAEQVFEAIATEYKIKDTMKRPKESVSAYSSPNRSPRISPAPVRRAEYQISMMNKNKKSVQFIEKSGPNYASDPNIHRSVNNSDIIRRIPTGPNTIAGTSSENGGKICNCQNSCENYQNQNGVLPKIRVEDTENVNSCGGCVSGQPTIQHKLVTKLRQACSLADLQNTLTQCTCKGSGSLNNINLIQQSSVKAQQSNSLDSLRNCTSVCDSSPVFILSGPPIYVLNCDHKDKI